MKVIESVPRPRKLASLYRGGFIKGVHQSATMQRSLFKQHVQLYHERVAHRASEAQKIIWCVRRLGVLIKRKDLIDTERREEMLSFDLWLGGVESSLWLAV